MGEDAAEHENAGDLGNLLQPANHLIGHDARVFKAGAGGKFGRDDDARGVFIGNEARRQLGGA